MSQRTDPIPPSSGHLRSPWLAVDPGVDPVRLARLLLKAHQLALSRGRTSPILRSIVAHSWQRAREEGVDPDGCAPTMLDEAGTARALGVHPVAPLLPLVRTMLCEAIEDAQYFAVLSDSDGVLLWIDGHAKALETAVVPGFLPGHLCSESAVGTNAVGTALELDHPLQIFSAEHFNRRLHGLTCAAAPIRDPETRATIGVLNISGSFRSGHPHSLPLVSAVARVVEEALAHELARRDDRLRADYIELLSRGLKGHSALVTSTGRILAATPRGWLGSRLAVGAGGSLSLPGGSRVDEESLGAAGEAFLVRATRATPAPPPPDALDRALPGGPDPGLDRRLDLRAEPTPQPDPGPAGDQPRWAQRRRARRAGLRRGLQRGDRARRDRSLAPGPRLGPGQQPLPPRGPGRRRPRAPARADRSRRPRRAQPRRNPPAEATPQRPGARIADVSEPMTDIAATGPTQSIDDLPVFAEIDDTSYGSDYDSLTEEIFARPYQGLMRTTPGGYTDGSVFVYRNEDIKALVSHEDLGNQPAEVYACPYNAHSEVEPPGFHQLMSNNLFTMHPPVHSPARQLVSRQLTSKSVARFAEPVEAMVRELVHEAAERGQVDFRHDVADRVMAGFWRIALGWTQEEADRACALATTTQLSNLLNPTDGQRRAINQASLELLELLEQTLARQLEAGTQELLQDLVSDYAEMDENSPGYPAVLEATFGASLLDGLHSLGGEIANVVHGLLQAPEALVAVRADRALVPSAFREGLRLNPIVSFTQRHALRDLTVRNTQVPEGTPVTMAWLFGNRDPTVFEDPSAFRLERSSRAQTTFGGGLYICPGRNIVRFLGEMVVGAVTESSLQIEASGPAEWVPRTGLHELESMPVAIHR